MWTKGGAIPTTPCGDPTVNVYGPEKRFAFWEVGRVDETMAPGTVESSVDEGVEWCEWTSTSTTDICDIMRPLQMVCFGGHFRELHVGSSSGVVQWHSSKIRNDE